MTDTLRILKDSLRLLTQANSKTITNNSDYFNYIVGIIGIISALITIYLFYQWHKSKKLQDFVYNQAKIALEKESTQEKLNQTKEELTSIENRLTKLQIQIQKDLPIEARKAVLKDKLEESLENLKKYYDDIISIKSKLANLGESNNISDILLKSIEKEIEPRFILKEKISNNKTYLTIVSTLAGIVFAVLPYPFKNYIGITLLLLGLPIVIQLIKLSLIKDSKDKQKTNLKISFLLSAIGTMITFFTSLFFWFLYFEMSYHRPNSELQILAIGFTAITFLMIYISLRFFKRYKQITTTR